MSLRQLGPDGDYRLDLQCRPALLSAHERPFASSLTPTLRIRVRELLIPSHVSDMAFVICTRELSHNHGCRNSSFCPRRHVHEELTYTTGCEFRASFQNSCKTHPASGDRQCSCWLQVRLVRLNATSARACFCGMLCLERGRLLFHWELSHSPQELCDFAERVGFEILRPHLSSSGLR